MALWRLVYFTITTTHVCVQRWLKWLGTHPEFLICLQCSKTSVVVITEESVLPSLLQTMYYNLPYMCSCVLVMTALLLHCSAHSQRKRKNRHLLRRRRLKRQALAQTHTGLVLMFCSALVCRPLLVSLSVCLSVCLFIHLSTCCCLLIIYCMFCLHVIMLQYHSVISDEDNHSGAPHSSKSSPAVHTDEVVSTTSSSTGTGSHAVQPQSQIVPLASLEARGIVTESEGEISLVDVPIITPNGDILVSSITIDVRQ